MGDDYDEKLRAMADSDETVVVGGRPETVRALSEKARARLERLDGPYELHPCAICHDPCLLGRRSRAMLDSGRAVRCVCIACTAKAVQWLTREDD